MAGTPPILEPDAEAAWELLVLGVEEPPPPPHGDAESAAWFRAQLEELGFTRGAFARFMQRRGDDRPKRNIQRSIQRMCAGQARVPGEMRVLLGLMLRSKQRKMARAARKRDEREAPWNDLSEIGSERRPAGETDLSESRSERPPEDGAARETERDERGRPAEGASVSATTPPSRP